VLVQDALFATLEPTTRRSELEDGRPSCSPTPSDSCDTCHPAHRGIRSTLEEVVDADLLVHVVDGSDVNRWPRSMPSGR